MFTLAHISDVHLSPLPRPKLGDLAGKRLAGYLHWLRHRKAVHQRDVLDRLIADMHAQEPDHIAVVGDLVNLGLPEEFQVAQHWLESLGPPETISVVPGNHDAYVKLRADPGIDRWRAYMDSNAEGAPYTSEYSNAFPYVRRLGPIALIGLSTAIPTRLFASTGALGDQKRIAGKVLEKLAKEGVYRIVLIHHPPLEGQTSKLHRLKDAPEFSQILHDFGAELVIHGHIHRSTLRHLETANGSIPIFGVPSASSAGTHKESHAAYNLYRISKTDQSWSCEVISRGFGPGDDEIHELGRTALQPWVPITEPS